MNTTNKKQMIKKEVDHTRLMREHRFDAGLSQAEMAAKLGMLQQKYSNLETGRTNLSVDFAKHYKKVTGVDLLNPTQQTATGGNAASSAVAKSERGAAAATAVKAEEDCQVLMEKISLKDELISALKAQIEILQRLLERK